MGKPKNIDDPILSTTENGKPDEAQRKTAEKAGSELGANSLQREKPEMTESIIFAEINKRNEQCF